MSGKMLHFRFEVAGDVELSRVFQNIPENLKDFSPALSQTAGVLRKYHEQRFAAEGAFEGLPRWAELTPAYAAWKFNTYGSMPILQLPMRFLLQSLTVKGFSSEAGGNIEEITPNNLTWGSSVYYAIYHQTGTRNPDGSQRMVARPPFKFSEDLKKRIVQIIRKYVHKQRLEARKQARSV